MQKHQRMKTTLIFSSMMILSLCLFVMSCEDDDDIIITPTPDPRTWTHEQLMEGSSLLETEPGNIHDVRLLYLSGYPFQMGYQQGVLLEDELKAVTYTATYNLLWGLAFSLAQRMEPVDGKTYVDLVRENSLDYVVEECEGMVAGSRGAISMDICLVYNGITYILEDLLPRYAPDLAAMLECSGFIAKDQATVDGEFIHARNLDWLAIDFIMDYPIVQVRSPHGGLRHVNITFPGFISVLTGMNEAGVSFGMDENSCKLEQYRDLTGVPPVQQGLMLMTYAHDFEEAEQLLRDTDQAACQMFVVGHGPSKSGGVFEICAQQINKRAFGTYAPDDVIWATNHFEHPDSYAIQNYRDIINLSDNSVSRFYRLSERLTGQSIEPYHDLTTDDADYNYGEIDIPTTIDIMRDPVDLRIESNRKCFPPQEFDNGNWALGNNHNVHSAIMKGETLEFWLAAGWDTEYQNPVYGPYVGFDMNELLTGQYTKGLLPTYDPDYNDDYCLNGQHPLP